MAKILCTVTNDLSQDQRMIRICGSLQAAGHQVVLIGREKPDSLPLTSHSFQQLRLRCFFTKGKFFYLEYNLRLFFYLLRQDCQIINAVDLDTLLPAYLVSRLRGRTCVYDAHEYFTEVPEVIRRPRVQKIWAKLADGIIPRLQHCYTVGPALAKIMTEQYRVPFKVVKNVPASLKEKPARPDHPESTTLTDKKIILYQGMLNEGRGLEVAITAMQQLPQCELWLAGSGDIEQQLKALSKELGLDDRVRFLGFVLPADLPKLTQQTWLGLNLLENLGLSYYYSLANKAFDYIQAALPSIQMDFPEYRAIQEEYGVFKLLKELTPTKLAGVITEMVENEDNYRLIQQNCQNAAEQLNWEQEEQCLLEIYKELV